jgi:hypothetical protein
VSTRPARVVPRSGRRAEPDGVLDLRGWIGNRSPNLRTGSSRIPLPTATIGRLPQRLASYMGDGLPVEELPVDRTELACVAAVRLAN